MQVFCAALLTVCVASPVLSIGLGNLSIHSGLGQPLNVTASLLSIQDADIDNLEVRLASPATYNSLGWTYPKSANEMAFEFSTSEDGNTALVVSTANGIDQTILPLIIQLKWPGGELQREYTVLLDPVNYSAAQQAEITENVAVSVDQQMVVLSEPLIGSEEVVFDELVDSSFKSELGVSSEIENKSGKIKVKKGDSLSQIAELFLPDGATKYQTRMAFFEQNPHAFKNNNINTFLLGSELVVPNQQDVLSYSAVDAKRRYFELLKINEEGSQLANTLNGDNAVTQPEIAVVNDIADNQDKSSIESTAAILNQPTLKLASSNLQIPLNAQPVLAAGLQLLMDGSKIAIPPAQASSSNQSGLPEVSASNSLAQIESTMQSFSTKMNYVDSQIVELRNENLVLKERIGKLELSMKILIEALPVKGENVELLSALEQLSESVSPSDGIGVESDLSAVNVAQGDGAAPSPSLVQSVDPSDDSSLKLSASSGFAQIAEKFYSFLKNPLFWMGLAIIGLLLMILRKLNTRPGSELQEKFDPSFNETNTTNSTHLNPANNDAVAQDSGLYVIQGRQSVPVMEDYDDNDNQVGLSINTDFDSIISGESVISVEEDISPIDSITESEVFMTYGRPYPAIQVLEEEYRKYDKNLGIIAVKLLEIHEKISHKQESSDSFDQLVKRLHADKAKFNMTTWKNILSMIEGIEERSRIDRDQPQELDKLELVADKDVIDRGIGLQKDPDVDFEKKWSMLRSKPTR